MGSPLASLANQTSATDKVVGTLFRRGDADASGKVELTDAVVTLKGNPGMVIKREAVLINVQRIRFLGELSPQAPPPEEKTEGS